MVVYVFQGPRAVKWILYKKSVYWDSLYDESFRGTHQASDWAGCTPTHAIST